MLSYYVLAKFANSGSILSSGQFLMLPHLPQKNEARFKSGKKIDSKLDIDPWNSVYKDEDIKILKDLMDQVT